MILHLDYETRSRVDLIKHGVYRYAKSQTTEIIWMGWAFDDEEPMLWEPGMEFPARVLAHLVEGARRGTHAHNAAFERLITQYVLTKYIKVHSPPLDHWYCTASQARARALPGSLDNLGKCLKLDIQKDQEGKRLIRKHSIPWAAGKIDWENGVFDRSRPSLLKFGRYCQQDVRAERAAEACSPPLTEDEFEDYLVSERINDRGIEVDQAFAVGALQYADAEMAEIKVALAELTGGDITSPRQFARIKDWIAPWMEIDDVRHAVTRYKTDRRTGETEKKISLDKAIRFNILSSEVDWPPDFLRLVELLDLAGSTSVSKYRAMLDRCDEGRIRGAYICYGAVQTKRFSSTGAQLHNMRRDTPKNFRRIRADIMAGRPLKDTLNTLAACLRPTLRTDRLKRRLVGCDLSQIEARVTPWLAGYEPRLSMYRDGVDVYAVTAEAMYPGRGLELRQTGKVAELSLQFGGAVAALQAMARNYQVYIDSLEARELVDRWRASNRWCTRYWDVVASAAMRAVRRPGQPVEAGLLTYQYDDAWDMLFCVLPSGGVITYPRPRVEEGRFGNPAVTAVKANWLPAQDEEKWPRVELYGGMLVQGGTQATAGEILRHALRRLDDHGAPVVAHTHDEVILDVPKGSAGRWEEVLLSDMTVVEQWMTGLPVSAETFVNTVYAH